MEPMNQNESTIVALATPAGTAAIALVRVSGPLCRVWAEGALFGRHLPDRRACHLDYRAMAGEVMDDVVVVAYRAPASYTGEDALEISCHGNPFIVRRLVEDLCARGARPALPGEFTQRAFLSGRLDLSQAEAVMDLIQARSDRSLAVAQQQLKGALGRHLGPLQSQLLEAAALVEAYIDFPDEDLPPEDRERVTTQLDAVLRGTRRLLATRHYGQVLREGLRTVIAGAPNAGKSSLLNRLVGFDRALVSPEPGTTRDFLEETVRVGPHALRLTDTAGLNLLPGSELEKQGIRLTHERLQEADLILWTVDLAEWTRSPALVEAGMAFDEVRRWPREKVILVGNKLDQVDHPSEAEARLADLWRRVFASPSEGRQVVLSAVTGEGLDRLVTTIVRLADAFQPDLGGEETIAVSLRHAQALERAQTGLERALHLMTARNGIPPASELVASEIRGALEALGEILGKYDHERMLDRLFAAFCIGK